jgi:hypothetical protein
MARRRSFLGDIDFRFIGHGLSPKFSYTGQWRMRQTPDPVSRRSWVTNSAHSGPGIAPTACLPSHCTGRRSCFNGTVIAITGGVRGIGPATATALKSRGPRGYRRHRRDPTESELKGEWAWRYVIWPD